MDIIIRKASLVDARDIAEIHARSFKEGHREFMPEESLIKVNQAELTNRWQGRLNQANSYTLVAEVNQKIIGLIYFTIHQKTSENDVSAEIVYFYIDPNNWRKGVGTLLWKATIDFLIIENIPKVFGWVLKSNPKSRAFYESLGAKPDGIEETVEKLGTTIIQIRYSLKIDQN